MTPCLSGNLVDIGSSEILLMEKKSSNGELLCRLCRARASSITSACLILFLAVVASAAQSSPPSPHALGKPQEFTVTVGIYVSAISDIDTNRDSFVADFYVWTYSPASASDPLATVTVARARSQVVLYQWKEKFGDQLWSLQKYRCEIFKNWNVANFPFDRHVIAIAVVPNSDEYAQPRYEVDEKNSGMGNNLALSGWRTENLRVFKQEVAYGSSFGDPNAAGPYRYGVVTASFLLSRKPWLLFFKLMVGAYLAAGAGVFHEDQPTADILRADGDANREPVHGNHQPSGNR